MERDKMYEVIDTLKPDDTFRLVFRNETFDGDLKGRIYMILAMHGQSIDFGELPIRSLQAVADSGEWHYFRTYVITVLADFDPDYFASRTVGREMLESVEHQHSRVDAVSEIDPPCSCGVSICGMLHPTEAAGCLREYEHEKQGMLHFNHAAPHLGEWEVGRPSVRH